MSHYDPTVLQNTFWNRQKNNRRPPDHPVVRALFEPRVKRIAASVADPSSASVLDVGCGNGFLTVPLSRVFGKVTGLDLSLPMLSIHPGTLRVCASATELPFSDQSFDLVVESHLLHHLQVSDRLLAVREMARVARHAIICYEPNAYNPLMALFGLLRPEERMSLCFNQRYLMELAATVMPLTVEGFTEGMIVPNLAPAWMIRVSQLLDRTPAVRLGFYAGCVAVLDPEHKQPRNN